MFPLLALVLLTGAARAAAPVPPSPQALERELRELDSRLGEERERLVMATVGIAGIAKSLVQHSPDSREAAEARALVVALLDEKRKETAGLELRTALLAEQLQRYKETGVLSPTPPATEAALRKLIDEPWKEWAGRKPVASLSLDLEELQKQLRGWRKPESFPVPPMPAAAPSKPEPTGSGFVRDMGMGRRETDPVPELIAMLSSELPRLRALAADQLGGRGASAEPAVPALRRALSDPDARVRASAALALGAVGKAAAGVLDDLRRALKDKDAEVRFSAQLALRRLDSAP